VPLARQADALAVVDAGRHIHVERPLLHEPPPAGAPLAALADELPAPAALRAGLRADELTEGAARDVLHLTHPAADVARGDRRPGLGAVALAAVARHRDLEGNVHRDSSRRVGKVDRHLGDRVGAASASLTRRAREEVVAEERGEEVAEVAEVGVGGAEVPALEAGVAVAVVQLPCLRVREHLVRLRDLAEALLGVGLLRHVRVQLAREPPEGLLDVGVARVARDAEQLVQVTFGRCHGCSG